MDWAERRDDRSSENARRSVFWPPGTSVRGTVRWVKRRDDRCEDAARARVLDPRNLALASFSGPGRPFEPRGSVPQPRPLRRSHADSSLIHIDKESAAIKLEMTLLKNPPGGRGKSCV